MNLIIISIIVAGFVALFLYLRTFKANDQKSEDFIVLNERLQSLSESVKNLNQEVGHRMKEQRESVERSTSNVFKQVQGFTTGITSLAEKVMQVQDSVKGVASFQEIFRAPKLRGIWGEMSLEASLAQYFSKDNFKLQHYFKSGEAVDAVLKLPNNLILPIDSKFNWENFEKMTNAGEEQARAAFQKIFFNDVKKKVDEIANKYILPSEGTTDIALMYIPAETVYYELITNVKDFDIQSYAAKKKVVMVSPNTFVLSVSAIRHWFKDVQLSEQTQEIMKRLERIATDGNKLGEDFRKLGSHISNARSSYENTEKRLTLMVDRVNRVVEIDGAEKKSSDLLDTVDKSN